MNTYDIYFEIYSKKLKVTVEANSEEDAKYLIRGKINFHKIVLHKDNDNEGFEYLKDIFNGFGMGTLR